jgi:hypothetical protein
VRGFESRIRSKDSIFHREGAEVAKGRRAVVVKQEGLVAGLEGEKIFDHGFHGLTRMKTMEVGFVVVVWDGGLGVIGLRRRIFRGFRFGKIVYVGGGFFDMGWG